MTTTWQVVRGNKEDGPFTGTQLKEIAESGKLLPTDLVRRSDVEAVRPASAIRGLFSDSARSVPNGQSSTPEAPRSTPIWENPLLIAVTMVFCFPISLVLIWRNQGWSKNKKWIWTGAVGVVFVLLGIAVTMEKAANQKTLVEANALWKSGDKTAAAKKYRSLLIGSEGEDRALIYSRLIDHSCDSGDSAEAKKLFDDATKSKIVLKLESEQGKRWVSEKQAEIAKAEAEVKEKERLSKMTPEEKLKATNEGVISAQALFNVYAGNEVAAEKQYDGKTIIVEGTVQSVEKGGSFSSTKITFQGRNGSIPAYGNLSSSSAKSSALEKIQHGSVVRIQGKCKGKNFLGTVELSDCIFVIMID